ncbi:hypothetical protein G6011_00089 [Alternaria panax]|uniref:AB hydrolase-1 domain-containing protein n=1 Tax=Alternaria panax TaxID=48097 RepID=A0AAD4II67_9PLEO|nr:hypothetical protein G6011_00089 [Alternaria panax]
MGTKPRLVLIPGAWHTPAHFAPLIAALQTHGYTTHSTQLASVGNPNPPSDLSEDVEIVRNLVISAIDEGEEGGNDVVVLAHSWGGIIAGCALVGLSKADRKKDGKRGGVVKTGYMAAYILDIGSCLQDAINHYIPPWVDLQDPYVFPTDPGIFYNGLDDDEQKYWFEKIQSQAVKSFYAPATGAAWKEIPTCYLLCEEDECVPPSVQEKMVKAVEEEGGEVEITRLKSGHSPFLSRADETVEWIRRVAGEHV